MFLITVSFLLSFSPSLFQLLPLAKYKLLSDDPLHFKILATVAASYDATVIGVNSIAYMLDDDKKNKHAISKDRIDCRTRFNSENDFNLPSSAKEKYYDAQLLYPDGQIRDVKYRFRGVVSTTGTQKAITQN